MHLIRYRGYGGIIRGKHVTDKHEVYTYTVKLLRMTWPEGKANGLALDIMASDILSLVIHS